MDVSREENNEGEQGEESDAGPEDGKEDLQEVHEGW